jgi:hypothetical protein
VAEQPAGTVALSITLYKSLTGQTDWWVCSAHAIGTRITFWERTYRARGDVMTETTNRVTDEIWDVDSAEAWILSQVASRLKQQYLPAKDRCEVPVGPLSELLSL